MGVDAVAAKIGDFLNERAVDAPAAAQSAFTGNLARVRDEVNHHVIPLALLAHADGEAVAAEQAIILNYCLKRAEEARIALSDREKANLAEYLRSYRPTRMQLAFAIKRLAAESKEELLGLVSAARAVIAADNETHEGEARFLDDIQSELSAV